MAKHILDGVPGFVRRAEHFMVDPMEIVIDDGWNGRQDFSGEEELVQSIISEGVIVPLIVRKGDDGKMHLVDGERRLRATRKAIELGNDIKAIPAKVATKGASSPELFIQSITANTGKPFTPLEEAGNFKRLANWGFSVKEISTRTGKSETHIRTRLQLVNATCGVKEALSDGSITVADALEISKERTPERQAERVENASRPHTMKNLTMRIKRGGVAYGGAGKDMRFPDIEKVLKDDSFRMAVDMAGFDPDSVKIVIKPKA